MEYLHVFRLTQIEINLLKFSALETTFKQQSLEVTFCPGKVKRKHYFWSTYLYFMVFYRTAEYHVFSLLFIIIMYLTIWPHKHA